MNKIIELSKNHHEEIKCMQDKEYLLLSKIIAGRVRDLRDEKKIGNHGIFEYLSNINIHLNIPIFTNKINSLKKETDELKIQSIKGNYINKELKGFKRGQRKELLSLFLTYLWKTDFEGTKKLYEDYLSFIDLDDKALHIIKIISEDKFSIESEAAIDQNFSEYSGGFKASDITQNLSLEYQSNENTISVDNSDYLCEHRNRYFSTHNMPYVVSLFTASLLIISGIIAYSLALEAAEKIILSLESRLYTEKEVNHVNENSYIEDGPASFICPRFPVS